MDIAKLVETLIALPHEAEWFEFKQNRFEPEAFGEYMSALANSAILAEQRCAYLVYGVEDGTHAVVGTTVDLHRERVGNEAFLNWLARMLDPRLTLTVEVGECRGQRIVVVEIDPAYVRPVRFRHTAWIRNGPHKRYLADPGKGTKPLAGDQPTHVRAQHDDAQRGGGGRAGDAQPRSAL